MKKIFLTFIVFAFPFVQIVFAQNRQTVVVRPETAREREQRKMNDVAETFQMLGGLFGTPTEAKANLLNKIKNSRYSVFVEEKLEAWKKKGDFEKTADWQKRLTDSTAIKKTEIQESSVDKYAGALNVLQGYFLNDWLYDSEGQYDADKEVWLVNTFWGDIPIPIPLDEAKNWDNIQRVGALKARFFIHNDQLALLSLSTPDETYIWENPSQSAQIFRNARRELEQKQKRLQAPPTPPAPVVDYWVYESEQQMTIVDDQVYESVQQMPTFPGGEAEMMKFINKTMVYPQAAIDARVQGRVSVSFVVQEDGSLADIKVVKPGDYSLDDEAIRVIKRMPKWIAGKQNGQVVKVKVIVPLTFSLQTRP